jgi:two-component system, cell cycle sensor histidine kinase and response regulator CckA
MAYNSRAIMPTSAARTSRSITSRVREALAAGSNTELLKALAEAFPGSWFFTRRDGTFAAVNQHACDSLGYTRDELMARTLFDVDPSMTPEIWAKLLAAGAFLPGSVRTLHKRKDGSTFPVEAFGSRLVLGNEDVTISYVVDLSEETETRQALAEKQHLLQSLLDNAPLVLWSVDNEGRFQLSEGSALSLLGLAPGEVVGKSVTEQFPAPLRMGEVTDRVLRGEPVEGIVSVGQHDFEYRYLPQRDETGRVIGGTGVAIDVTARRRAERSNRRLMKAIEQADVAVLLLDPKGGIEYVNSAFETIWRSSKIEATGRSWPDLLTDGLGLAQTRDEIAAAIASGTGWRGTIQLRWSGDDECIQQATLTPMHNAVGEVTGFVVISRDVTAQTRTEERLRQIEKMDAVGQLAGGVAHDFNNLLQVIMGNADLCLAGQSPEAMRSAVKEIREAGKQAAGLVRQLLTFSRNVGTTDSVSMADLVARLMPLLRRLLGEHILIELHKVEGRFDVRGDESQLEQVIVNLCVNARDAMPEGGRLDLRLSERERTSAQANHLGVSGPGRYVVLEVTDTGCGMSEDVQRRAFEPFFTTKALGVGTGLGLATVWGVAKRHGGTVELRSSVGSGSRFCVWLGAAEPAQTSTEPASGSSVTTVRPLRVLLAEDDAAVRDVTRQFLVGAGHDVVLAGTGNEAIVLLESEGSRFELLVLDAIMPGANGPEVFRRFRAHHAAPVLFVTGHDFDVLASVPPDTNWAALRKPFNAEELTAAIAKLVGK